MPELKIFDVKTKEQKFFSDDFASIKHELHKANIDIETWQLEDKNNNEKIAAVKAKFNFKSHDFVDIDYEKIGLSKIQELNQKFLREHTHTDDEIRFFIDGQGLFVVHHQDQVYSILCSSGDFIRVPAATKHWFDMGEKAFFSCLRFFGDEKGWQAEYTGSDIAKDFPLLADW